MTADLTIRKGKALPCGASLRKDKSVNFSVSSSTVKEMYLELYFEGDEKPFTLIPMKKADEKTFSVCVGGLDIKNTEYTFLADGQRILDPYAKLVTGRNVWNASRGLDVPLRAKVVSSSFDWKGDRKLRLPLNDLIIYETHVRGLTRDEASPAVHKGLYEGVTEMIPYFKKLGINCVELMPLFEFDELAYPGQPEAGLFNYWGYSTVSFFAPKNAYAGKDAVTEMKEMVKELHRNGIEVILDVVYNHTAENGENGRVLHYRALNEDIFYMRNSEGRYADYSGCGNSVNANHSTVCAHIMDSLRYWVTEYHVDGFRFDLAPVLVRDSDGSALASPPLIKAMSEDPVLKDTLLIAETWDAGGLYMVGSFPGPSKWAEWNDKFRDTVRRFLCGDAGAGPSLVLRIQGSPDIFRGNDSHTSINFVTCHDGFTLNDLFSYNCKHNEENGEGNRDGSDYNISCNCGEEGPSADAAVNALRNRQVKNAFALLMLSRGTPMMYGGDEFRNSQNGNNNAYCQDSPVSWLNWENLEKYPDVFAFFRTLIRIRNDHPAVRRAQEGSLSFHGVHPWNLDTSSPFLCFGFMYGTEKNEYLYCCVNCDTTRCAFTLPDLPQNMHWSVLADSSSEHPVLSDPGESVTLCDRSLLVLESRRT